MHTSCERRRTTWSPTAAGGCEQLCSVRQAHAALSTDSLTWCPLPGLLYNGPGLFRTGRRISEQSHDIKRAIAPTSARHNALLMFLRLQASDDDVCVNPHPICRRMNNISESCMHIFASAVRQSTVGNNFIEGAARTPIRPKKHIQRRNATDVHQIVPSLQAQGKRMENHTQARAQREQRRQIDSRQCRSCRTPRASAAGSTRAH